MLSKKMLLVNFLVACYVFLSLSGMAFNVLAQGDTWSTKTPMPTARGVCAASEVNGIIYVIGGLSKDSYPLGTTIVEAYDPETDTWTRKADMPTGRFGFVACTLNGKIYAIAGDVNNAIGGDASNAVEAYDPQTNSWQSKQNFPVRQAYIAACSQAGKIYVMGGGGTLSGVSSAVYAYDPATDTWESKSKIPTGRTGLAADSLDGKIYVIGGAPTGSTLNELSVNEAYDPVTDSWSTRANMHVARASLAACSVNGMLYAMGGQVEDYGAGLHAVEEYDSETDTWLPRADMPTPRVYHVACAVNGKIYVMGGTTDGNITGLIGTVEEYVPPGAVPYIVYQGHVLDDCEQNNNGRAEAGETVNLVVTLKNVRYDAIGVSATLRTDDPEVRITQAIANFGDMTKAQSVANEANPFIFSVSCPCELHYCNFYLDITSGDGLAWSDSFELAIGTSTILLVDDDGGDSLEVHYTAAMNKLKNIPGEHNILAKGCPNDELFDYGTVIWFTGNDRASTLTPDEQTAIAAYLDAGGRVLMTGQDIGYDLVRTGAAADSTFYANYLHASFVSDSSGDEILLGVNGDPISNDMILYLNDQYSAENQVRPDAIAPIPPAEKVFEYIPGTTAAGLRYENELTGARLVYLAFGFEGIGGPTEDSASELMNSILTWLGKMPIPTAVNSDRFEATRPQKYALAQNYPNPFNPTTTIRFDLPKQSQVEIVIFNILGQPIRQLLKGNYSAGMHQVTWDGQNDKGLKVSSGVYFYRMQADGLFAIRKMILMQ